MKCCHDVSIILINKYLNWDLWVFMNRDTIYIIMPIGTPPPILYIFMFCCILMQNCSYKHLLKSFGHKRNKMFVHGYNSHKI